MGDDDSRRKLESLEARAFADVMMTGSCPRCGSDHVHSCEYDPEDPDSLIVECGVAKAVGDPLTGHCESCGCLFCTECREAIPEADDRALSELPKVVDAHEKACPELKPRRWAQKYGSTYLLVSVKGRKATIGYDDYFDPRERGKKYVARIGEDCGMTPREMAGHVGERMRFDVDPLSRKITAVGELPEEGGPLGYGSSVSGVSSLPHDDRTQVGVSHYTKDEFLKAKSKGLFPGDDFESYREWQAAHRKVVRKMVRLGYRVADVEVKVDEFIEWQRASKQYDRGAVSAFVAELLRTGRRILKWYN